MKNSLRKGEIEVKKKVLSTLLLITIMALGVFIVLKMHNNSDLVDKNNEKLEKVGENIKNLNENVILEEVNETEAQEIAEYDDTKNDEVSKAEPTPSASSNKTSQTQKATTQPKTSNTTKKQEQKKETKVESTKEPDKAVKQQETSKQEPTSTYKHETVKPVEEKKEEEKTKEVVVEVPDSKSYKDDPAFIKLQKELFRTFKECNDAGEKEWRKDSDNVSNIYCEAEYYKGVEAGIRLYIVYNDKTWKKYLR